MKTFINTFRGLMLIAFCMSINLLNAQTFNYGTGDVSGNTAPFAAGNANVTVSGNDVTVTGNTTMTAGTYNFANFTINTGVTITVTGTGAPLIIKCTGTFTNNGLIAANGGNGGNGSTSVQGAAGIAVAGGGNGGLGGAASSIGNPGVSFGSSSGRGLGGNVSSTQSAGGGGGGFSANGSNGFAGASAAGGAGGSAYGNSDFDAQVGANAAFFSPGQISDGDRWLLAGSGAGGGGGRTGGFSQPRGGGGGAGGGAIQISANTVNIGSQGQAISVRGGNGGTSASSLGASGGAGGGGAGGSINIQYFNYSNASGGSNIIFAGGTGGLGFGTGNNVGRGGSGAEGRLLLEEDEILCIQPTIAATNFGASNITQNSADLSWVRGDGDGVIVVISEGSPFSGNPVSGTSYTANQSFGDGDAIGNGFVVYVGTGTSVNVTNLPDVNTTYHVAVFEFNDSGSECYQLASLEGSFTTADGPMIYLSSTNVQQTGVSLPGSANQEILRLEVNMGSGSVSPLSLSSLTFNTTGTTTDADITSARVYYTGGSDAFATSNQFGSDVSNPSGSQDINGSQELQPGINYFWLVYDVSISANPGNFLDAQITSINVGGNQTPTETDPAGNRVISSLLNLTCAYNFTHFTPTWTSNVGQAGTTVVASGAGSIDDQRWPGQSFATDFSFEFNGQMYTEFGIHSKGFIWFGDPTPAGLFFTPISAATGYDGAIVPFAFDMVAHSSSSTTPQVTVRYTGTAPNRVCIIEWTAMRPWGNTGGLCSAFGNPTDWNRYDFQLHLHENGGTNSDVIEFIYRDMNSFCVNGNGANAQVGLRGASNTDFLNRQGSGNTAHTASSPGAANNSVISHGANNYFNGNGGMRFTPSFQTPDISPTASAENTCPDETVELSTTSPVASKQWYRDNLPILGATDDTYTATESGTYIVVVTQGGCAKVSEPVVVTINSCITCTSPVEGTDVINSCGPITWIDGNTYTENNNTATFLLEEAAQGGCDSLVTLNLTIFPACVQLQSGSCGATEVLGNQLLFATNENVPQYRFRVTGPNNGGTGWDNDVFILDRPHRYFYFNHLLPGFIYGSTYTVEVATGDGNNNFGPYGPPCDVTLTSNLPTSQIQTSQCGATVDGNSLIFANQIFDAQGYRFKITGQNNGGAGWDNEEFILDRPNRNFYFSWLVPGATPGATFSVEVAYLMNDGVTYSPYGAACDITLNPQSTQIQASQCGATGVMPNALVFANQVFDAQGYRFRVTGSNTGSAGWDNDVFIFDRTNRYFTFQWNVPGTLPGETYEVEVAFLQNDGVTYSAYGSICEVTLFGAAELVLDNDDNEIFQDNKSMVAIEFGAHASHNPFTTEFALQVLNANDQEPIAISIYDMSGKLIERNAINPMDIETARFGSNLAAGMYMIEVRQGSNQAVIRQIKD